MVSTATMIEHLSGLLDTKDLNEWETGFVRNLHERAQSGQVTSLTEKQVETLDRLYKKHFA
jgi:hypothetical protein